MINEKLTAGLIRLLKNHAPAEKYLADLPNNFVHLYKKNEVIINMHDSVDSIYILVQGHATVFGELDHCNGIISHIEPLEILGLLELLCSIEKYTAFVIAHTNCQVVKIPVSMFNEMIKSNSELCYQVLLILGKMTAINMQEAATKRLFPLPEDLIGYYFYLQSSSKRPYICTYTREQLSEILNINLRTLYRHLYSLKTKNFISITRGKITITDENFKLLNKQYADIVI